jgi:hypothetical protein
MIIEKSGVHFQFRRYSEPDAARTNYYPRGEDSPAVNWQSFLPDP